MLGFVSRMTYPCHNGLNVGTVILCGTLALISPLLISIFLFTEPFIVFSLTQRLGPVISLITTEFIYFSKTFLSCEIFFLLLILRGQTM